MHFSENLLSFIWRFRLYGTNPLYCASGESLRVISPGILNTHAGPDFSQAKLIIGDTTWVGNIEIHSKSSDWLLHGHQDDHSFTSVILHVVYQHDRPIYRKNGTLIPVLVLKELFPAQLLSTYTSMISTQLKFPCAVQISGVARIAISGFLSRLMIERLEDKSLEVLKKVDQLNGNWDEAFYNFIARSMGFKVNAVPFDLLANSLPQQILAKHKDNNLQVAALVFGQAGFLSGEFDNGSYPKALKDEFAFLQKKYQLKPIDASLWKFLRMRPQNFPTVRLAQFTALMISSNNLFSKILALRTLPDVYELFSKLPVDAYWLSHYHFNKTTRQVSLQLGLKSIQNIVINTVCLFLFTYGNYTDQQVLIERAIDFLEQMPAENNAVVKQYAEAGFRPDNSFQTQALLQLNKFYCSEKKCLNCGIGIKILNK